MELQLVQAMSFEHMPASRPSRQICENRQAGAAWLNDLLYNDAKKETKNNGNAIYNEDDELEEKVEKILEQHVQSGDYNALFLLGQLCFEQCRYDKAEHCFLTSASQHKDWQAMFQLGVMYYDGLGVSCDPVKGFAYMYEVATSSSWKARHMIHAAQYNVGLAFYNGIGVKSSRSEAEKFWLLAADNGNPQASVKAQSTLGLFYSSGDSVDMKKTFYWHSEACGNGSLESQGALGVMYLNGFGTRKNEESAFICFKEAAQRGNIYATGHLISYYYQNRLFTKALGLATRISQIDIGCVDQISVETDCMPVYIKKGIAMACFYYARCLALGRAILPDPEEASKYYVESFKFDPDTCNELQKRAQLGEM